MVVAGVNGVGRIEADPSVLFARPDGDPGVGGVGALEPLLARRRNGADISAHIGRRQSEAAQAPDHDLGEVLADAAPLRVGLGDGGRNFRRLRLVGEVAPYARHQIRTGLDDPPFARETLPGVVRHLGLEHDPRAAEEEMRRRPRSEIARRKRRLAHSFPSDIVFRRDGLPRRRHPRDRPDREFGMLRVDRDEIHLVAEEVELHVDMVWLRRDLDAV